MILRRLTRGFDIPGPPSEASQSFREEPGRTTTKDDSAKARNNQK